MKDNLDYSTEIPHLSEDPEAVLRVSITNYRSGSVMSITADTGSISFSYAELKELLDIFIRYDLALEQLQKRTWA